MSVIYKPMGMGREYSPYAVNIYIGCSHRCKYCYAPHTLQKKEEDYFGKPVPRKDILKLIEKDLQKNKYDKQVYYKFCLRRLAPNIVLTADEKNLDAFIVKNDIEQLSIFNKKCTAVQYRHTKLNRHLF